jgi:hypothetical protein
MAYSVSSWFVDNCRLQSPTIKRVLTIAGSDYSSRVTEWPKIVRDHNDIRPGGATVSLANDDGAFNFFRTDTLNLRSVCVVKAGFTHSTSGDELITLINGRVDGLNFSGGQLELTIADKVQQLSNRVVGAPNSAVSYTASGTLPSDIAWWLCTSYGGFSAIQSTSNPDINWALFQSWAAIFSLDNAQCYANFEGQKVTEGLRKIGRMTLSSIVMENDKLCFRRFSAASSIVTSYGLNELLDLTSSIDDVDMTNRQYVYGGYTPSSDTWSFNIVWANSASVNSFDVHENSMKDENLWYPSSSSALSFAQRIIVTNAQPFERVTLNVPAPGLYLTVGDTISVVDNQLDIVDTYRIMNHSVDLDSGRTKSRVDKSQLLGAFTLDVSSLDGSDLLL